MWITLPTRLLHAYGWHFTISRRSPVQKSESRHAAGFHWWRFEGSKTSVDDDLGEAGDVLNVLLIANQPNRAFVGVDLAVAVTMTGDAVNNLAVALVPSVNALAKLALFHSLPPVGLSISDAFKRCRCANPKCYARNLSTPFATPNRKPGARPGSAGAGCRGRLLPGLFALRGNRRPVRDRHR